MLVWANGSYAGKLPAFAAFYLRTAVQIVKRTAKKPGSEVLPRR